MFCHRGHLVRLRTWPGGIKSFPQTWLIFFTSSCDEISGSVKYSIIRCHLFSAATCHFCPAAETSPELRVVICVSAYHKLVTHEVLTGRKHRRGSQSWLTVLFLCLFQVHHEGSVDAPWPPLPPTPPQPNALFWHHTSGSNPDPLLKRHGWRWGWGF